MVAAKRKVAVPAKAPPEKSEDSFHPKDRSALRAWLEKHHAREAGIWLIINKIASGKAMLRYEEIVEEALCFGWIDSKPRSLDEARSMLWLAPRKKGSNWSKLNKQRAEALIRTKRMAAPGLRKVEEAKKDGSWDALNDVENLLVPDDLAKALAEFPHAGEFFEAFPRSVKRAILEWISNAKKPETRQKRVAETAALAEKNIRANQWRQ